MSLPSRNPRLLSLSHLKDLIGNDEVDTVVIAFTDMQGRLQGKRLHAAYFLDVVLEQGAEGCNYLLGVDVDMNTVDGYEMASWDTGYGDFEMKPDLDTLRPIPWHEGTVLLMGDLQWDDGTPVVASPRQILRRQLDRLAALSPLVTIGGSLVAALALLEGEIGEADAFAATHLDEMWHEEKWGTDAEAIAARENRRADFAAAARMLELLSSPLRGEGDRP